MYVLKWFQPNIIHTYQCIPFYQPQNSLLTVVLLGTQLVRQYQRYSSGNYKAKLKYKTMKADDGSMSEMLTRGKQKDLKVDNKKRKEVWEVKERDKGYLGR